MNRPVLLIDNFDSFSHMLADYIMQTGVTCEVLRNDDRRLLGLQPMDFLALVISPGPGVPRDAGLLMQVLPNWVEQRPVLGICLGHQALGEFFGAKLKKAKVPRHGKVDEVLHSGNLLFKGIENRFLATRYHSLVLDNLPPALESICHCENELMGLIHRELPVYGLQFHPESCETKEGIKMIKNFIDLSKTMAQN
jgi:anthranilate synthase/aminodeoxychorismate synthase-like glutamine amidotransferase